MAIYPKRKPIECSLIVDPLDLTANGRFLPHGKLHVVRVSVNGKMSPTACGKEVLAYYRFPCLMFLVELDMMCKECRKVIQEEVVFPDRE